MQLQAIYSPSEGSKKQRGGVRLLTFVNFLTSWIMSATTVTAQDVSVSAQVEPNPLGIDEQLSMIITVTGPGGASQPQIPKIDGLKLVGDRR
jgi:hypothetical protein